jgi:signal transduction histidine kinase
MFNVKRYILFKKPSIAYRTWVSPQHKKSLLVGAIFTLITVTLLSYVDYFFYYSSYTATKSFGWDNAYRLIVVPLIGLGVVVFSISNKHKTISNFEWLAGVVIFMPLSGMVGSAICQPYYTSDEYTYDVLIIILFTQLLFGLSFRTAFVFSFVEVVSVLVYLGLDQSVEAGVISYNTVLILTVWACVLLGAAKLEQSRHANFLAITKLEQAHDDLLKQTLELKSKNEDLQQFAYASSHDLQEPLRTISNFVTILNKKLEGQLTEEYKQYLGIVLQSTDRMKNLIHAILEYSRIGRNKQLERIDCNELLQAVIVDLDYSIQQSNGTVTVGTLPVIYGYKSELASLFQNLISNALKFRRAGVPPVVQISVGVNKDGYLFCVRDNGIGIDPKYADKIFQLFSRLHNKEEYEGTGIGLTHGKKIVELHGGRIWLESCDVGTTFCFSISNALSKNSNEKEAQLHHAN